LTVSLEKKLAPTSTVELDADMLELIDCTYTLERYMKLSSQSISKNYHVSERALHMLGLIYAGCTRPGQLIEYMGILPSAVTFETDKLVAAKLIRRERDPGDRRAVHLALTPKGRRVRDKTIVMTKELLRPRLDRLTPEGRRAFLESFRTVADGA
jgi:DNA-binding MarR family transcriptional regulator